MEQLVEDYLRITDPILEDSSVKQIYYTEIDADNINSINNQTEITFTFQNTDQWMLPSKSYLIIEGQIVDNNSAVLNAVNQNITIGFNNNGYMQMFDQAKYILGTQQIEYFQNCGITTLIHNLLVKSKNSQGLDIMWKLDEGVYNISDPTNGTSYVNRGFSRRRSTLHNDIGVIDPNRFRFRGIIPLSHVFNFCQDYKKVVYGMQHRITFQRRTDYSALIGQVVDTPAAGGGVLANAINIDPTFTPTAAGIIANTAYHILLTKFKWAMPIVMPNDEQKLTLSRIIEDKTPILINFLNKRYETPLSVTANASQFNWKLQLTSGYEKPRFVVVSFQDSNAVQNPPANHTGNYSKFYRPDISNAYALVNGIRHPYSYQDSSNSSVITKFYRFYKDFRMNYLNEESDDPAMDLIQFNNNPIYVFDISKQEENFKHTSIDVTLQFNFNTVYGQILNVYAITYFDSIFQLTSDGTKQAISLYN